MDVRSPFYSNLALIIACVMFLNPIVATAAQLAVDGKAAGNTSLSQAGNGVPVVNIATPNGKGLSHNKFSDYNVGQQGLILNNVTGRTQATQLGGIIVGNPNLQGKAAGMILNEVTGANPSQLRGYTEVAGQAARVIVANPHGITCDGCGFINTPRATLSTGRPVVEDGQLSRFDVDGGQIAIEGAGLNASNVEQFDLITRSAKINAELHANTLNIVTGRNAVDADSLAATAKADDGSDKPMLALDSSALGGMYAGAIRLVGTEGGVGVKLAGDMAASAGDIQIDAAGKLTLANTSASGNLAINAGDVALAGKAYAGGKADISAQSTLRVQQSLAAAGNVSLQGKQVINSGVVEAGVNADNSRAAADLQVSAEQLRNAGSMIGNRQLQVEATQLLDNRAGTLSAKGAAQIDAGQLDNRAGRVLAGSTLNLSAADVDNRQAGLIRSQGAADVQVAGALHNQQGQLVSEATLAVQAQQVNNQAGQLIAGQALQLQAQAIDNSAAGVISAQADAQIAAQSLSNVQGGEVSAGAKLGLDVTQLDNSDNGAISSVGALTLQAGHVNNRDKGRISSQGAVTANLSGLDQQGGGQFVSRGGLTLDLAGGRLNNSRQGLLATPGSLLLTNVASIDNSQGGEIASDQAFTLVTTALNNSAGKILSGEALELRFTQALLNNLGGLLSAGKQLNVRAASLNNSGAGQVSSRGDMRLDLAGEVSNSQQGLIVADGGLHLAAARIDNSEDGEISSQNELTLVADSLNNSDGGRIIGEGGLNARLENLDNRRNGLLASNADLVLQAKQIDNSAGGTLSGVQLLTLSAETLNNQSAGRVLSGGVLQVTLNALNNSDTGLLSSRGDLLLHGSALNNRGGTVVVDGQGQIVADSLDSSAGGLISASQGLSISAETLSNQGGELSSAANLNIQAARLDNSAAGKVIAGNALSLTVAQLLNQAKGVLSGAHSLTLSGASLDNSGAGLLVSQGAIDLELSGALNNREGGSLLAQGPLHLQAASLDNSQDGLLSSKAGMTVALTGELNNQAGALIADGALQLDAQQLDNREQGVLSSKGNLRLGANQVDNRSGSIVSDASLDLKAEGLNNSQGQVASKGDLDVELDHLVQQGGELLSQGSLRLAADDIDNSQAGLIAATQGIEITAGNLNNSSGGEISSKGAVAIDAADLNNSAAGLVLGDAGLHLTVQRLLNHSLGVLSGRTGLVVRGDSLDNSQGGILTSQQMLNVQLSGALDNHDQGALLSEGALQLQAGALNNTRGVLSSAGALAITTGTLNNQGGKLVTDDQLNITSSALDNSQGGRISAKQALSIVTGQLDNQQQGQISGAAALSLTTDQLNNHNRGLITAKGIAQVRASGLDQHQGGELFSESALTLDLQGGALNNSGQGLIATPGVLLLNNLGAVDNSAGGEISSNQSFLLKASQLNNSAGRVISGQDLHLQITQALLNNLKGVLSAAKLNVAAASLDNSAAGVLASKGDIQVTLTGTLDNHDQGIVSAAQALSISSAALDNSGDGLLASGGDLQLSTGALNNQGGSLLSQAALDVSSAALDNRGGALSSQQGLTLSAAAVDNSDNGLITSAAGLTLSATRLDSSAGGEVSAKQDLQLTVSQLIQQQGRLIGEAGLRVDLKGGDLDNRGGLLSAQGPLSLLNLGTLDNRNAGEVSSRQSYSLTAKAIDNGEQGRLISAGNLGLDVDTGTLRNANGGLISGWQGLTLNAGNLDNSALGTLSSRDGALTVNLKGSERVLNNSGAGALVSKGALSIEAGSLNNSGQGILSSEGDLELRLTGALNNSDRGLIDSQGSLTANAGAVNNHSGQISSVKAANVNAASLDNQAGQLSSNAALNLTLSGNLINTLGKLASTGPLVLKAQAIDNQGGSLLSQSLLDLAASSLNNANGGTLAARKGLNLLLTGALNNSADGLIHSLQSTVDIRAQSLNNNGGTLGSQSDLRLVLDAKLDNQGGHIQSRAGNLDLQQASAVDNSGGVLSSLTGWLKLATAGLFNNDAGTTQAQALTISAQGVDNRDGHISALSGDTAINIGSATFNNQGGGLYAHQLLDVSAGTFNNQGAGQGQGGKVAAGQIDFGLSGALNNGYGILESSGTLGLTAASLDNRNGSLRALGTSGDTRITATSLDNRNGGIETANSNLDLNVASLQSAGGSILHVGTGNFGLNAAQVSGAGGDLRSNGLLSLTADNWTNSGVLQAGRLVLNVGTFTQTASGQLLANQSFTGSGSTWTNNGLLASDGSFSLNLSGAYSGSGQVTSLGSLSLSAGSVDLSPTARLSGGELTTVTSTGLLTNRGRLTSVGDLTLRAGILSNYGTLGSAQRVTFYVPELLNDHGLLFSGGSMSLWTSELNNRYGDIYSLGMLDIARNAAFNKSNSVVNFSGSIVSAEDARVFANTFYNDRDEPLIAQRISISRGQHHPAIFGGNSYSWIFEHSAFSYGYGSPRSSFESGGSLIFNVGNFNNTSGTVLAGEDISISADLFVNQGFTSNIDSGLISGAIETSAIRAIQSADRAGHLGDFSGLSNSGVLNNSSDVYYLFKPEGVKNFTVRPGDFGVSADSIDGLSNAPAPEQQAIIQAGGAVTITANNVLQNGVTREFLSDPPGLGLPALVRTDVNSTTKALDDINPQLSPNLQQQQVNPLTLPGFTLPQGENGLFRLSGQQAQSTTVQQASGAVVDRTLAGRSVALGQQEQSLSAVDIQGRSIAVTTRNSQAATQVAASDPQLSGSEPGVHVSGSADPVQSALSEQGVFTGVPSAQTALPEAPAVPQLPQAQGFSVAPPSSHKYLIETNPELTNLKQFMGSDYLLGNLGYDPDAAQKRLGDGLYEQRLVREAVVARTGQRFLAGLTSDEAMYRYLMDNALASKDALGLSLGVTLSGEQVAALTHDIVWLEEHEVNGEKVLVPVLYLAQAEGRLAANGALIQGRDVTLISGGELLNQGTLRASENLTATAGNINNSGLIEAGERLQLLATDSIRNAQGGIIAGRDVSLTALTGDVINERSVTRHEVNFGNRHDVKDYVDSAARIEAANSLSIVAGRDVANLGAVLESGGDLSINAGRDVTFASVEERVSQARGGSYLNERVTQIGAQASAGRDLEISAGRDLSAIASQLDARRDLALEAGGDVLLASAANEDHFYSRSKKVTRSTDKVVQQSTTVQAGRDISIAANEDLTLVASQVKAGNNVSLDAEQDINILSAKDESASFYFKKKKGSFGRSSSKQQEKYDSTNIASVVEAGNDLTLNASKTADGGMSIDGGRDVTIIGSQLQAGGDLLVGATGDVAVLSGVEEHGSYSKKTKSGFLGLSKSGKSQLKTKASQVASELDADNDVVIAAGNDIRLRASETSAGNDLELRAGLVNDTGDINLVSANDTAYSLTEQYKKKVGLSASGGFVSIASAKEAGKEAQSSTSVGSQVTADRDAALQAERDINVIGSGISAGRNLSLDAGRDVNVVSAENSSAQRDWEKNKQVGIGVSSDDNGVSVFVGAERIQEKNRQLRETAAASQLSAGRDLDIAAGRDINQTGSDLLALNDINLQAGRDIKIDAAREALLLEQQRSEERQGLGVTVNHNFGNTKEAASNAGKGENGVSQASSTLRAVDSISQFLSGPTADVRLGNSKQSSSQQYSEQSNRSSTLSAGNDLNLQANNDVTVKGGQLDAGRDINIKGRDVTLDVARGNVAQESEQSQSWAGVQGGTSGGLKLGIGGSRGVASEDGTQGTSTATQLAAGRDINMQASNDLTLIGSQAQAGRDIDLKAGNDLDIRAVQNASRSESERRSAGGEVGLSISPQGVGPYVSANLGKGQLERVGQRQQEAYLYAGDRLSFSSGEDTRIAGAILRGDEVIGRVGGDLSLSSLPDTGSVKGKEFDLSGTVSMTGISGSIGAGKTTGKTNWVQEQTSITARDRLDIRTENHTQIDGAIIASDTGNLKLDTDTLGYSDIAGQDKERAYYLNVGGSFGLGGGTPQDASQVGKGEQGVNGWSVEGYNYERDREQIVRATVGAGDIVVRSDAETGEDSTAGLNRDVSKAYEITKDKEERTDLYVSKSSVEAVGNADETLKSWGKALANYDEKTKETFKELGVLANASLNELEKLTGRPLAEGAINAGGAEIAEQALHGLIMSGMSLDQAKALLADQAFQDQVLAELRGISLVFSAEPEVLRQTEQGLAAANVNVSPDALELADSVVKGTKEEPRLNQVILDRVSAVNSYIKANPGKEEAVGYVLAAAQGPKGLIMWAAEKALSETPFGEKVAQYEAHLKDLLGKAIAEGIEDRGLEAEDYNDAYLLGGGGLIATLLVGAAVSGSSSKVIKVKESGSPATNQNSHAGQADNETGYPLPDRPVVGGAKGPGAAEVPATSAITRDGLRNDLAAQAGIPRSLDKVWGASVDDLAQAYKMDGATLVPKPALSGTSGKAQAFTVEGHPTMKEVQVHPGGGTHGAPYYKFTYKDGAEVRVIDPASGFKPGTITSVQQYFDTAGNRLRYEAGQWKLWE